MSEVKRFSAGDVFEGAEVVYAEDFDRVNAELANRKAKHLRSCQIAIGKSQLAKQRHAEVNALQALLTTADEELDQCRGMALMIEEKEWAEHVGTGPISSRVESAFTQMHNELSEARQGLTAADERADVLSPGSALGDVHLERLRQIDVENRSPVDDDDYSLGQLAYAAAGYAQGSVPAQQVQGCLRPSYWPWHPRWWKPGSPRRMLVKAAALILAEIERIDRAELKPAEGGGDE